MKTSYSLRVKLTVLFLITIMLPVLLIMFALPTYYRNLLSNESQTLTEALLTLLSRNIETYLDDLNRLTISLYVNTDAMHALKMKVSGKYAQADEYSKLLANRALTSTPLLQNLRKDIVATVLLPLDGTVYVNSLYGTETESDYSFTDQAWYKQAVQANGDVAFISVHSEDYFPPYQRKQVFSVARLIKDPDSWKPLAVMMADADTAVLSNIVSDLQLNVSSVVCILDANGHLIFSNKPISDALLGQIVNNNASQQDTIFQDASDSYVSVSKTIPSANWKVVVLLSNSEINAKVRGLYIVGLLFALGGLVITFGLFVILSRWIVSPFQQMMTVMKKVQHGDLESRFVSTGKDEIADLGNAFNHMVGQLSELIDREYKAVLNQRNAEYLALQSQIQPHFLYNTLNSFIALNRRGERTSLEKAIYSLSNMLRYTLDSENWVMLESEFSFLQRYCDLQHIRFHERLTVNIYFQPELARVKIPKLLLQPLVENAVIHGMEPLTKPCDLVVCARLESTRDAPVLKIVVSDNGVGFNQTEAFDRQCIGLSNVRERLRMAYPESTFSLHSTINVGTEIVIEIPLTDIETSINTASTNTELGDKEQINARTYR